jgi:ABC-type nitrate/sulfonate/bicarbonate transport system substrate-binding protein
MFMKKTARASVLGVTLAALALSACGDGDDDSGAGGDDGGLETVRVMMFPAQAYRMLPLVAQEEGIFEEHGIEMEITEQPAQLQGVQGLEATESDVGQLTVGTLGQGVQGGNDAKFFCGGIDVLQTTLMTAPDSDLPSTEEGATWEEVLQSLEGKKVGIQTPVGSGLQLIFAAALEEAGVTDVTYVNLGGAASGTIAALQNGSVDVAQTNPPTTQFFQDSGQAKPLLYMSEGPTTYKDYYGSAWSAPTSWIEEKPEVAEAFCDAMDEALEYINDPANKDAIVDLFVEDSGLEQGTVELMVDQAYGDFSTAMPEDVLGQTIDAYTELGIFKPTPEMSYEVLVDDKS